MGRRHELDVLRAALADSASGRGQAVFLAGEAGIGKTRLAEEAGALAEACGAMVHWGRCWEGEGAPPFWPWIQVIRGYADAHDPSTLLEEMGPGASDLAQIVPELSQRFPSLGPPQRLEPAQARFRLFDSVTRFLARASCRAPFALILDDLHWADPPSLTLLKFLVSEIGRLQLLIIGTYRDVELDAAHRLAQVLADLARHPFLRLVRLQGLSEEEARRFVELSAPQPLPPFVVPLIHRQTEGNPLFLREMVGVLAVEGAVERWTGESGWTPSLPRTIRDVILRRLASLSGPCKDLLSVASAIGREFDLGVLGEVSGLSVEGLLELLDEACAGRVLAETPGSMGRYGFHHVLIRETLYEQLGAARRLLLHRRIGETLETRCPAEGDTRLPELARHFFQAAAAGDADKAITYAIRAGERASTLLAHEEAAGHYERALQALELKRDPDHGLRCELLLALGDAHGKAGNVSQSRQVLLQAASAATALELPEQFARAALGLGGTWIEVGEVDATHVCLLEEALGRLGEADSVLRANVLARLAMELYWSPASAERRADLSRQAVEMARRIGDPECLARTLRARAIAIQGPDNLAERMAIATEVVELVAAAGRTEIALPARVMRLYNLLELGDIEAVDRELAAYSQQVEQLRIRHDFHGPMLHAMKALLAGRFAAAEELAQQAYAEGQLAYPSRVSWIVWTQLFFLHAEQGRLAQMQAAVERRAERLPPGIPAARASAAAFHSLTGNQVEARRQFERLAAHRFSDLPRDATWLATVVYLCHACLVLADRQRAEILYELLLPYGSRNVVAGPASVCYGSAARYLGLLAELLSRCDAAAAHFEEALKMNQRLGALPLVAHTQHEHAGLLFRRGNAGDRDRALELLARSLETARQLGMAPLVEQAAALAEEVRRPNGPDAQDRAASDPRDQPGRSAPPPPLNAMSAAGTHAETVAAPTERGPRGTGDARDDTALFRREGEYWTIASCGHTFRLKDGMGLHYLSVLLRNPGREFLSAELAAGVADRCGASCAAVRVSPRRPPWTDAGHVLDRRALSAYRCRVEELQGELKEAESINDSGRAATARAEIDFVTSELSRGLGLRGRQRTAASPIERARQNVTRRIKVTLRKISQNDPSLGRYLATTVRTGTFCSYEPSPRMPISWQF